MGQMCKIMFLDDLELNHLTAKICFKKMGINFSITYCECPIKALLMLKNSHYDLLITDFSMPILSGYEVIKFLKKLEKQNMPVIAFSSVAEQNDEMMKHSKGELYEKNC